jgi:hypothetical protein
VGGGGGGGGGRKQYPREWAIKIFGNRKVGFNLNRTHDCAGKALKTASPSSRDTRMHPRFIRALVILYYSVLL